MESTTRETIKTLDIQRQALEQEAAAITSELTSPTGDDGPPMGIDTPLVDSDGYPRADIDIYRARTLRGRLAEIRTDHAKLMKQIEPLLVLQMHNNKNNKNTTTSPQTTQTETDEQEQRRKAKPKPKYDPETGKWVVQNWDGSVAGGKPNDARTFASIGGGGAEATTKQFATMTMGEQQGTPAQSSLTTTITTTIVHTPPFARIDAVAPHSPAAHAGLQEGDIIRQFGHITSSSMSDPFHEVAQLVPRAAGQQAAILLIIQRRANDDDHTSSLTPDNPPPQTIRLTPKPWEGRGLLGCHIVPFHQ